MSRFPIVPRWRARFASSLRLKLLALALIPLLLVLPMLIAVLVWWGGAAFDRVLRNKVQADLAVADGYFDRVRAAIGQSVDAIARSHAVVGRQSGVDRKFLQSALDPGGGAPRLDFLNLLDLSGRVRVSSGELPAGQSLADWAVVAGAHAGHAGAVVDVFAPELLAALDPALAARADIPLKATRNALPSERRNERRGLVIHAAAPVRDAAGRLVAVVEGGVLLNRNFAFIDRIDSLVFPEGSLIEGSHGTATLFLGDVRIATNVRLERDERAIGTRLSETVRRATLDEGKTWLDRAFVVNDWYVSGYQPLLDSAGQRVGLLYIGFLEAPLMALKRESLIVAAALFAFALLFATVLSLRGAASIFRPIRRMKETMLAVEAGELDARVGTLGRPDELGRLAADLDHLLDELQNRNAALTAWGRELDAKVEARTRELSEANRELAEANRSLLLAQRQLVMSEKLATIGELTAGMAHEINNPMAVIQGNLDFAREVLGPAAAGVRQELGLIDQQVDRVRQIVDRLLQFARPSDYSGAAESVGLGGLFADCLVLVAHLLKRGNIAVAQNIDTERAAFVVRNELEQVLLNLLVNAIQAMPDGGTLGLEAHAWDGADGVPGVALTVRDSGQGIAPEHLSRIFEPFFTTKTGVGTGLGLAISNSLVHRHGGRITVDSEPAGGAAFTVWLPAVSG